MKLINSIMKSAKKCVLELKTTLKVGAFLKAYLAYKIFLNITFDVVFCL